MPAARVDTFSSTEASMRLDAVGSAGFRISRSKMADFIAGGAVKAGGWAGARACMFAVAFVRRLGHASQRTSWKVCYCVAEVESRDSFLHRCAFF